MKTLLMVGVGGFLGAVARHGMTSLVSRHYTGSFPVGTLVVNVLGCFLIGGAIYLVDDRELFGPQMKLFVMAGILGSFTTFSALGRESVVLIGNAQYLAAVASILGNVIVGVGAVVVGRYVFALASG
ncbi:MAG: fluoride efflux transporter CrcB [Planctomycetota bacterium]|jgi:CrcB protein|nr:fluoride efflux transporter CrcB [Planctomycetota bacterium]